MLAALDSVSDDPWALTLREPPKELVLRCEAQGEIERQTLAILLDNATGTTSEVVVSLTANAITSWTPRPGVQPGIMPDEFFEVEQALKRDPAFQQALRKRGVTDFDLVMVDPWAAGNYGAKAENERDACSDRLRSEPNDNGYARPSKA